MSVFSTSKRMLIIVYNVTDVAYIGVIKIPDSTMRPSEETSMKGSR